VLETYAGCSSNIPPFQTAYFYSPFSNWPQTISPLPQTIQTLSAGNSFPALSAPGNGPASWKFSFTLTPLYTPDDDCKQSGGSSIGCRSQSLGEDGPIAGTGFVLHHESSRQPDAAGNAIATADAAMFGGWTLSAHHTYDPTTNTLFLGDGTQRNGTRLGTPVSFNGDTLVTSEDGGEIYVFNSSNWQHLQTLRPLTGAVVYKFGYDSSGRLVTVTDATGNVTTIQRNASGSPTAIVAPFGETTSLAIDQNGFLAQITDPLGFAQTFVNSAGGLLMSRTDANGNTYTYSYQNPGLLQKAADPVGGFISATRATAATGLGWTNTLTTAMGRKNQYQSSFMLPWAQDGTKPTSEQYVNVWSSGLQATASKNLSSGQLSNGFALPDGRGWSESVGPDPVWGIQVPIPTSQTLTQGALTASLAASRSTTLGTAGNPFTISGQTDTESFNDRTYTHNFNGATMSYVDTSPAGRTLTVGLDSLERVSSTQVGGLLATQIAYDGQGRLQSRTQGTRTVTFAYDSAGYLASVTDPLNNVTSFVPDADGRLSTTKLPDGRVIAYAYDANGNLTSVTPPGKSPHVFTYTPVNLPASYTPPAVAGAGATSFAYNLDRDLTTVTRPDGSKIDYGYDNAGRLTSIAIPTGTTMLVYDSTTGNLASEARSGETVAFQYNGSLSIQTAWTGAVSGSVERSWNSNFWVASESVNGESPVSFAYDNDGLVAGAGSLTIQRSAANGLITGTTLGVTADVRTYNTYGELVSYTASANGSTLWSVAYTRDVDGRIVARSETIGGTANTYSCTYDVSGRLTMATKNGVANTYAYDSNSNRIAGTIAGTTSNGAYDAQDRLLTYGATSYTYTANGELATSQTVSSLPTSYTYDALGNLIGVVLPNGEQLAYVVDPDNHRVGRSVNGALQTGFLYEGHELLAQLNNAGQVVSRFVYATSSTIPDYMVTGGTTYRIFSDERGSPVLVVNSATGAVVEQIAYDEFGNVSADTNPGLQPFGFAGGLYDPDTELVRFGARDYHPKVGRWTAKDPILFGGGSSNLYTYVSNDPVNGFDSTGLQGIEDACGSCDDQVVQANLKKVPTKGPLKEWNELNKRAVNQSKASIEPFWTKLRHLWETAKDALCGKSTGPPPPPPETRQPGGLREFQTP
jgi:RHS repeat-associated protein